MSKEVKFLCSSCGLCCKTDMKNRGAEKYGLPIKEDGSCGHLVGNLCSIYDNRPACCNSEENYKGWLKDYPNLDKKEYFKETTKQCHDMIDNAGADPKWKINLEDYE
jgi:Fe-S-cluster containining protein